MKTVELEEYEWKAIAAHLDGELRKARDPEHIRKLMRTHSIIDIAQAAEQLMKLREKFR